MGDIGTHKSITKHVRDQVELTLGDGAIPPEHFGYLELGNFLADVSQFRDPPAHHGGREQAYDAALEKGHEKAWYFGVAIAWLAGAGWWASSIFGKAGDAEDRHGELARFFERMVLGVTHILFADDGAPPDPDELPRLPAAEVDRVYATFFTQYWPHEHLDFPPLPEGEREHHHRRPLYRPNGARLTEYLDEFVIYLSEGLSRLELEMVESVAAGEPATARRDHMVRLGRLLHGVEDFWFHSNFAEVLALQRALEGRPGLRLTERDDVALLVEDAVVAAGGTEDDVRDQRLLHRRLRYPSYVGTEPSKIASLRGDLAIFTGGFGPEDVFHTIGAALERMEEERRLLDALGHVPITLLQSLFDRSTRAELLVEKVADQRIEAHEEEVVEGGAIDAALDLVEASGRLPARAVEEFRAAFEVDREAQWPCLFPGVGGTVISLLAMVEEARVRSQQHSALLDGAAEMTVSRATANGASAEQVGTHSLMAKDSESSEPLRSQAVALAKHASASVATLLLERVLTGPDASQGLDWDELLRFYLRYPDPGATGWWDEVFDRADEAVGLSDIADRPDGAASMLGPDSERLAARRRLDAPEREELQARYRQFES